MYMHGLEKSRVEFVCCDKFIDPARGLRKRKRRRRRRRRSDCFLEIRNVIRGRA